MYSIRTRAEGRDGDHPEWLKVIWAVNDVHPEAFGAPELGEWWAGGTVEEYPDARVLHRGDGSVSIVAKTERGEQYLREAAAALGIHVN